MKNLFVRTPSLDECKRIMLDALWNCKEIQELYKKYNDLKFTGKHELIKHEYYQIWQSEEQNQLYRAYCRDIRNPVEILWKGLS